MPILEHNIYWLLLFVVGTIMHADILQRTVQYIVTRSWPFSLNNSAFQHDSVLMVCMVQTIVGWSEKVSCPPHTVCMSHPTSRNDHL